MGERLRLRAESAADLEAISALVQDMALLANDIAYDAKARRLVLMGNRYRHEAPETRTRIRSALRLDYVERLQHRAMPADPGTALALLAVTVEGDSADSATLVLSFGGGTSLRATVEVVDVTLEDVSGPWGAQGVPTHGD